MFSSLSSNAQKLENPISEAYLKKHLVKKSPKLILTPQIEKELKSKLKSDPLVQRYYQYLKEQQQKSFADV